LCPGGESFAGAFERPSQPQEEVGKEKKKEGLEIPRFVPLPK
jgi:hypothetical protein